MHYTLLVALPGDIAADKLRTRLDDLMDRFDENRRVALHRDTSVYAESFADQLEKARASVNPAEKDWTVGLSDEEIVEEWCGHQAFDADDWPLTTGNPDGQWDWWVVGGRWGGAWQLRGGAKNGPLATDEHVAGFTEKANQSLRTDNARWRDLIPESITPTYTWLDLAGDWHTRWIGPSREEALMDGMPNDTSHWEMPEKEHHAGFMKFLAGLPGDAWLVHIDFHN